MATDLILAASRVKNVMPYKFESTNINVYSFEQALYHCYKYWKESWDEIFIKDNFISWVREELEMSFIATEIVKMKSIRNLKDRIIAFLSIVYYFDDEELNVLENEIQEWQNQSQSEKLKEKGDALIAIGSYEKAIIAYKAVLSYDKKNYSAFNNIGVGYMYMEKYAKAKKWFLRAFKSCNKNDKSIIFNIIEACVCNNDFDSAEKYITLIDKNCVDGKIFCFKGEVEFGRGNFQKAIEYYKHAISEGDSFAVFKLVDAYEKQGEFDMAIRVLDTFDNKDIETLVRKSIVYEHAFDFSSAVRCIEKALLYDKSSVELWIYLARYYRLNNNFVKAEGAVCTALRYSRDDFAASLEMAKIKRAQGKVREYRMVILKLFKNLKNEYRDIYL